MVDQKLKFKLIIYHMMRIMLYFKHISPKEPKSGKGYYDYIIPINNKREDHVNK
jgi:hypothetical protein